MKIALFTDTYRPYISGVVNSIDMIKQGLEEKGHEVYIVCMTTSLDKDYIETNPNVIKFDGKKYPLKQLELYRYMSGFKKKADSLKKYNFDVVHIHTEFSAGKLGMLYAKRNNVPLVYTFHTNYEDYFKFVTDTAKFITHPFLLWNVKRVIKKYQKRSDALIVPTKKVENIFRKYKFKFPVEIIPTGIDVDIFNRGNVDVNKVDEIKKQYNLENKFVFCSIGRVSFEKSIDTCINAFAAADIENSVMLICGVGPAEDSLKELVKKLNIEDKVIFAGMIPYKDIPAYYAASNIFLNASSTETQGLTYIEAISSGVPILVKKDEALEGLLIEKKNGMYFETAEELTENIKEITTNTELFNEMQAVCPSTIEKYTRQHYALTIEKLYNEVIECKKNK